MTKKDHKCSVCSSNGLIPKENCPFCNGTGEYTKSAESYFNNHICMCLLTDRKNCPVCHKECHHDTSLNPKQKIEGGQGGTGTQVSYKEPKTEEIIIQ